MDTSDIKQGFIFSILILALVCVIIHSMDFFGCFNHCQRNRITPEHLEESNDLP